MITNKAADHDHEVASQIQYGPYYSELNSLGYRDTVFDLYLNAMMS